MKDSIKQLKERIKIYKENQDDFPSREKGFKFIANPDKNGFSIPVPLKLLNDTKLSLEHNGNGSTYMRSDKSKLYEDFNIILYRLNGGDRGKIISIRLAGSNKESLKNKTIRKDIHDEVYKETKACPHSGLRIDNTDHKNGRDNNPRVLNKLTQVKDDFQGTYHSANVTKRTHCTNCKKTNKRFDATVMGFPKPQIIGGAEHDGSPDGCIGCYWYDMYFFTQVSCGLITI